MMDLILLCKLEGREKWKIVSNPDFDRVTPLMRNTFNDYAEYSNSGVIYRAIRRKDLQKYNLDS